MKSIIVALLTVFVSCVTSYAQGNKKTKAHQKKVNASAVSKTPLLSLDSFYCSGNLMAVHKIADYSKTKEIVSQSFSSPTSGVPLIVVQLVIDTTFGNYYNYSFPTLGINCDVLKKAGSPDVYETICKQQLLNTNGIDTIKAQTFVTIKGNLKKKQELKRLNANNFKVVKRNVSANISLIGQDIQQDNVIIGSMEESTVATPGGTVKQIKVYNTQKHLICIATQTAATGREWRMLTHLDNKYHLLTCKSDMEDVYDILKLLIENTYL